MRLSFCGAARQVTGSMYLLELNDSYKILIDCGTDYEQSRSGNLMYWEFPFEPADIDLVILTHAHIDHSGNLPLLVKQGYRGHILCTPATGDLIHHLLMDSANIQQKEYKSKINRLKKTKHKNIPKPLYSFEDVKDTSERVVTLDYNVPFKIREDVNLIFYGAGHLLGAASPVLTIKEKGEEKVIGFTGDIGRENSKLVKDPQDLPALNYLISESTYGGREHKIQKSPEDELFEYIQQTCVAVRGKLIIPAFSVGRTQAIVFTLHQLALQGRLPDIPIFVDSPLALKTTGYYHKYVEELNNEAVSFHKEHNDLFQFENIRFMSTESESDQIKYHHEAHVIISAAGMVEGGRIQEHVMNNIQNPFCTILIAGFCAEGTLGFRLLQGQKTIRIKNKELQIYAKIAATDVFSSHADHKQLLEKIKVQNEKARLKKVFLVHGEESSMNALASSLENIGITPELPVKNSVYEL